MQRALAPVFAGDWHTLLRDPLDLFRLSFGIGALVFVFLGDRDVVVRLLLPGLAVSLTTILFARASIAVGALAAGVLARRLRDVAPAT
jgi:hypothetical protein